MGSLLGIVLPLALGAAVTPTIIGAQLVTLSGVVRPLARAWALAAGAAVVLTAVSALALLVAGISNALEDPSPAGGVVKLTAGVLLAGLGVRAVRHRGDAAPSPSPQADERPRLRRSFALGAGLMATNFSSLVLYFPAMHAIGISGRAPAPASPRSCSCSRSRCWRRGDRPRSWPPSATAPGGRWTG